jgi:hypothetical protein
VCQTTEKHFHDALDDGLGQWHIAGTQHLGQQSHAYDVITWYKQNPIVDILQDNKQLIT